MQLDMPRKHAMTTQTNAQQTTGPDQDDDLAPAPKYLQKKVKIDANLIKKAFSDPFAPAHLPIVSSAGGILLVLILGLGGALNNLSSGEQAAIKKPPAAGIAKTVAVAPAAPKPDIKAAEVELLKAKVEELNGEIAALRRDMASFRGTRETIGRRLTSMEDNFGTLTASINKKLTFLPSQRLPSDRAASQQKIRLDKDGQPLPPLAALPGTVPVPETSNQEQSVAGIPALSQSQFGLILATNTNSDHLAVFRDELLSRYPEFLTGVKIHIEKPARGAEHSRLIAGPFSNAARATEICVKLKARKRFCHQTAFPQSLLATRRPRR